MPKDPALDALQKQCRAAGLSDKGRMTQLVNRLQDHTKCKEIFLDTEDYPECEAILATKSKMGSDAETKREGKVALAEAVEKEELEVENVVGRIHVGNRRGLDLANIEKRLQALEQKQARRLVEITLLQDANSGLRSDVDQLNDYVSTLRLSLKQYRDVRQSFISCFKRDKLQNATEADNQIILGGNKIAHGGDAVADALLYDGPERRRDTMVFIELYGMHPFIVQKIQHKETIEALNMHASVRADTQRFGTEEFYTRFKMFAMLFVGSDLGGDYLSAQPPTELTRAYWQFHKCQKYCN